MCADGTTSKPMSPTRVTSAVSLGWSRAGSMPWARRRSHTTPGAHTGAPERRATRSMSKAWSKWPWVHSTPSARARVSSDTGKGVTPGGRDR
jgi:hypothetical protein